MTSLRYETRAANMLAGYRAYMEKTGRNASGDLLWQPWEDDLCKELWHDRRELERRLPHRSNIAVQQRCQLHTPDGYKLYYTAAEVKRLKELYPTTSWPELLEAFPGRTKSSISFAANRRGIYRVKKPLHLTGNKALDEIRQRAQELNISVTDISNAVGSQQYFCARRVARLKNYKAINHALRILGGRLTIKWD